MTPLSSPAPPPPSPPAPPRSVFSVSFHYGPSHGLFLSPRPAAQLLPAPSLPALVHSEGSLQPRAVPTLPCRSPLTPHVACRAGGFP